MSSKRKAGDEEDIGSSPPPAVKVKIEQIDQIGSGAETNDRPIDEAPTSDQLAESERLRAEGRVEGEKIGAKKALAELAINNANNLFMCPIGLTMMYKPVIAADGNNYEEITLVRRLKDSDLSPLDNKTKLTVKGLIYQQTVEESD